MDNELERLAARLAALREQLPLARQRLTEVQRRLHVLRRRGASVLGAAVLFVVLLGSLVGSAGLSAQQPPTVVDQVVCRSLKVTAADGKEQLWIGFNQFGGFVKVFQPEGKLRGAIWPGDARGSGSLVIFADDSKARLRFGAHGRGGGCEFFDAADTPRAYFGCDLYGGAGKAMIMNAGKQLLVELGEDHLGGTVFVNGHDSRARVSLWTGDDGHGLVTVHGEHEQVLVGLGGDEDGGLAWVTDPKGRNRGGIIVGKGGKRGLVSVVGQSGKFVAQAGSDVDGGGVFILGHDGKARSGLGVQAGGQSGFVSVVNSDSQLLASLRGQSEEGNEGGQCFLNTNEGKQLVALGGVTTGGSLDLADKTGRFRVHVRSKEQGATLTVVGTTRKQQAYLGSLGDGSGAALILTGSEDNDVVYGGPNKSNGAGLFQLFALDAKHRVVIAVDDRGVGYANGYNAAGTVVRGMR